MACETNDIDLLNQIMLKDSGLIEDGDTPLYIAAFRGNLEAVKLLLQNKADVNQATQDGLTPLFIAAQNGHMDIVYHLLTSQSLDMGVEFQTTKRNPSSYV